MEFMVIMIVVVFIVLGIALVLHARKEDENMELEIAQRKKKRMEEETKLTAKEQKYQSLLQALPYADLTIEYDFDKFVLLKEESSQIILNEHLYTFKDILDFTVSDNQTVIHRGGDSTATTTTSTGSMLGRAVVGGVLTGGIGALVGAATARKDTEIHQNDTYSSTKHNYYKRNYKQPIVTSGNIGFI